MRKISVFSLLVALTLAVSLLAAPVFAAFGGLRLETSSEEASASQVVGFSGISSSCQSFQATFHLANSEGSTETVYHFLVDESLNGLPGSYITYKHVGSTLTVYATTKTGTLTEDGILTLGTISSTDGTAFTVEKATDVKVVSSDYTQTTYPTVDGGDSSDGDGEPTTHTITAQASAGGKVTASAAQAAQGQVITLTAVSDSGYVLQSLRVTAAGGGEVSLTDLGGGKYTFAMPDSAVAVKASFVEADAPLNLPFTDVGEGDWFLEAVRYVYENGLMDGTSATTFDPLMTTNRAMVVTILWRATGEPAVDYTMSFGDVADGTWYTEAVRWAASEGIVTGYSDRVFAPNDTVTREQLAVILYRYASSEGYDVSAKGSLDTFADGAATSTWAVEAMEWAVGSGLLSGKSGGVLDPTGTATRAEVATILMRFLSEMA